MKRKFTGIVIIIAPLITAAICYWALNYLKHALLLDNLSEAFFDTAPIVLGIAFFSLFLILALIGYVLRSNFCSNIANCLLLAVLSVAELVCVKLNITFSRAGGTIYPPLSAVPKVEQHPSDTSGIFFYAQFIIVVLFIVVVLLTIKNWPKRMS